MIPLKAKKFQSDKVVGQELAGFLNDLEDLHNKSDIAGLKKFFATGYIVLAFRKFDTETHKKTLSHILYLIRDLKTYH